MKKSLFFAALSAVAMCACQNHESDIDENKGEEFIPEAFEKSSATGLTTAQKSMMSAQAEFNCEFFKEVVAQSKDANLVVSPVSMSMDLAMLANGACGETLSEIHKALGSESASQDDFNKLNNLLYSVLPSVDPKAKVALANSIWVNKDLELKNPFVNVCSKSYDATVKALDMYNDNARIAINQWAESKTNGLIKNFLEETPCMEALLMNALYFKAPWLSVFDEQFTAKGDFYGEKSTEKVDFMENRVMYCYSYKASIGDVISFPFGNASYSLSIVTPTEGVAKAISSLTPQTLATLVPGSETALKTEWVKLPKFKLEYKNDELAKVLQAIGMEKAFSSSSDFSAMAKQNLVFNKVIQQVAFEIDEKGGEGAAVSGEGMSGAYPGKATEPIVVNRPFIFLVSEKTTGSILFMGKVTQL